MSSWLYGGKQTLARQLSCSRRARASLTNCYWCALLSRASSQIIAEQPNPESPLPTIRPEAWRRSQSFALSWVSLGRFVEQLNSTLGNAVSYIRDGCTPTRHSSNFSSCPPRLYNRIVFKQLIMFKSFCSWLFLYNSTIMYDVWLYINCF